MPGILGMWSAYSDRKKRVSQAVLVDIESGDYVPPSEGNIIMPGTSCNCVTRGALLCGAVGPTRLNTLLKEWLTRMPGT
jgi:hypothetical protein